MQAHTLNLHDPETLVFDETPELFVRLDVSPIIFSIRGLKYFKPRFALIGRDISLLKTVLSFTEVYNDWTRHEYQLLLDSITAKANATHQPNEHKVLLAACMNDIDAAEIAMGRLEHSIAAGLKIVKVAAK